MKHEQIEAIRNRANNATEGPWSCGAIPNSIFVEAEGYELICGKDSNVQTDYENAVFIANSRQDIPELLAEIERLQGKIGFYLDEIERKQKRYDELEKSVIMSEEVTRLKAKLTDATSIALWSARRIHPIHKTNMYDWIDELTGEKSERL